MAAVGTALAAFIVYDLLFTEPRFSLAVSDTTELLNLVPRPDRRARDRAARGARAGTGRRGGSSSDRGDRPVRDQPAPRDGRRGPRRSRRRSSSGSRGRPSSSGSGSASTAGRASGSWRTPGPGRCPNPPMILTLVRMPGDEPARWVRAHDPVPRRGLGSRRGGGDVLRIKIETEGTAFGSLWAVKAAGSGSPDRRGDPAPVAGRRPDRPGPPPRSAAPGGDRRRGRSPERRAQERPARLGLARPAHAARQHPGDGREPRRPGAGVVTGRRPRGRRIDRQRGAAAGSASCDPCST